jgi:hypothetical protein
MEPHENHSENTSAKKGGRGKHEIKELQKTTILGTAHILRKLI